MKTNDVCAVCCTQVDLDSNSDSELNTLFCQPSFQYVHWIRHHLIWYYTVCSCFILNSTNSLSVPQRNSKGETARKTTFNRHINNWHQSLQSVPYLPDNVYKHTMTIVNAWNNNFFRTKEILVLRRFFHSSWVDCLMLKSSKTHKRLKKKKLFNKTERDKTCKFSM